MPIYSRYLLDGMTAFACSSATRIHQPCTHALLRPSPTKPQRASFPRDCQEPEHAVWRDRSRPHRPALCSSLGGRASERPASARRAAHAQQSWCGEDVHCVPAGTCFASLLQGCIEVMPATGPPLHPCPPPSACRVHHQHPEAGRLHHGLPTPGRWTAGASPRTQGQAACELAPAPLSLQRQGSRHRAHVSSHDREAGRWGVGGGQSP